MVSLSLNETLIYDIQGRMLCTVQSEVARLREEIEINYLSAQLGLNGLAAGMSRHSFITARMERIGACQEQLKQLVGSEANTFFVEALNASSNQTNRQTVIRILQHELGTSEDITMLIDWIWDMWETMDKLTQRFGEETA